MVADTYYEMYILRQFHDLAYFIIIFTHFKGVVKCIYILVIGIQVLFSYIFGILPIDIQE